jgi:hypothetical protein
MTPPARWISRRKERWSKVLTLVGAFTVFGTFVTKEAMRDRMKDLADSLRTAQAVFILRFQNSGEAGRFLGVQQHLWKIDRELKGVPKERQAPGIPQRILEDFSADERLIGPLPGETGAEARSELRDDLESDEEALAETGPELENLEGLVESMPRNKDDLVEITRYSNQVASLIGEYDALDSRIINLPADSSDRTTMDDLGSALGDLDNKTADLLEAANTFGHGVFDKADQEKVKAESEYAAFTWASYIFYTLGWCLGLVGEFYGYKIPPAE